MPLKIDIKSHERIIINGAVLENLGSSASVLIHNKARILREKEILSQNDAATPASRVYFAVQCAYIFPEKQDFYHDQALQLLGEYLEACPSAMEIGDKLKADLASGNFYQALKVGRNLIGHEISVLEGLEQDISRLLDFANQDMDEVGEDVEPEKSL